MFSLADICNAIVITLIGLSIGLTLNQCIDSDDTYEAIIDHQLDNSLDNYYPLIHKCRHKANDKDLLIVSTLDGKLSAVDVSTGHLVWSKQLSSQPLFSSTISGFEITKRGRVVRVVPSLDGNLYLFNGKTIDGLPLNADTLLKSSYKLGDDLVITGGQESQLSGIDISTGRVYYECGINGCPEAQLNENETFDDLVLLKRITQTVRAIDPKTGRQKWYFTVSEPQLSKYDINECDYESDLSTSSYESNVYSTDNYSQTSDQTRKETKFKVIVPNGFISAHIHSEDNIVKETNWSHRFDSPIVYVWHYRNGQLNVFNLFDKQKLYGLSDNFDNKLYEPSVYIGLYRSQWYIQLANKIKTKISGKMASNDLLTAETTENKDSTSNILQIEWKPEAVLGDKNHLESDSNLISKPPFSFSISSDDNSRAGYYIFSAIEDIETKCLINSSESNNWDSDECDDENDGLIQQIVIASLWYYWREVTAISVVSAFLLNIIFSFLKRKFKKNIKLLENEISEYCAKNDKSSANTTPTNLLFSAPFNSYNSLESGFISRYESDFEEIKRLGKGGFGVVFEAKHLIDESHYAVKRIYLPIRKEQREKVMREVRALSKLDHTGIVRYYNAWVELPPHGWKQSQDKPDLSDDYLSTNDLRIKDKQIVNKSIASDKSSFHLQNNETTYESSLTYDKSDAIITQTQSNQSIDIVFDENVSSIKLINTNIQQTISKSKQETTYKSDNNLSNSHLKDREANKSANRPNTISPRCYLYIQMQLCRKDTLKDWLLNNSINRNSHTVLDIFDQIVSAVHYVHSTGLMHRDLKPSNIFFSMDGNIKIGDFGLVTATAADEEIHTPDVSSDDSNCFILNRSSSSHTNCVGTQLYMSPEQIRNQPYSHKVDIFSMGIILFELLVPFNTEMERTITLNNARKQIFPKDFIQKYKSECNLLTKLLDHNPDERPSTAEIKEHEILDNFQSNGPIVRQRTRTISLNNGDHL
ncbi:eukaryotic translation initiation factor 2-alpha kinase-like [Oppia nitens]|uniref:eukaryotic translation initiation factor 2-alpha kinase-like n=1 Tax=Oppia nitens TaxID=1686743 RepID=UPI0023DB3E18|nr:eukaryotic translation initiation factor 2-alpha kinase-like [Oppia nitens]